MSTVITSADARLLRGTRAIHDFMRTTNADTIIYTGSPANAHAVVSECTRQPHIRRFVYQSTADVYATPHTTTSLIDEDAPLTTSDAAVADLDVLSHNGSTLEVAVLRCAEIFAPNCGSQLWDYLQSRVCLRPLGFDPMINLLSSEDAARALTLAAASNVTGVFNIPGATTLPLSSAIQLAGRADVPVPGALMAPLYHLRRRVTGFEFRYDRNLQRFHVGGILDGTRARMELGFTPHTPAQWPQSWWRELLTRLGILHDARAS